MFIFLSGLVSTLPLLLSSPIIGVSTEAECLTATVASIMKLDFSLAPKLGLLLTFLRGENNGQGLGATSVGWVMNARQAATGWIFILTVGPIALALLPDWKVPTTAHAYQGLCPYSWSEADGRCFKRFGDDDDKLGWHDAEEFCQVHGGHLASMLTHRQYNVAVSMAGSSMAWIGLNDEASPAHSHRLFFIQPQWTNMICMSSDLCCAGRGGYVGMD